MPKYVPLYMSFWRDPHVLDMDKTKKLAFIYFIGCEECPCYGIYQPDFRTAAVKIDQNDIELHIVIKHLVENNEIRNIRYDKENHVIFVVNKMRYSSGGSMENIRLSVESGMRNLKTTLWKDFIKEYPQYINSYKVFHKDNINIKKDKGKGSITSKGKVNTKEQLGNSWCKK